MYLNSSGLVEHLFFFSAPLTVDTTSKLVDPGWVNQRKHSVIIILKARSEFETWMSTHGLGR